MKNKRMIAGLGLLIFIAGIGGLCFFLGRQSGKKQTADAGGRVSASNENDRSGENNWPDGNGEMCIRDRMQRTAVSFLFIFVFSSYLYFFVFRKPDPSEYRP